MQTSHDVRPGTSLLGDYDTARARFTWEDARAGLDGLPGGGLNMAYEAVDRHVTRGDGDRIALRFLDASGVDAEWTYAGLADRTARFAEVLRALGIRPGEMVAGLSGRLPDLYAALLGTLKARSVFSPLFSAFGPEPVRQRLDAGHARLLVTTPQLYRKKVAQLRDALPDLQHVLLIGPGADELVGGEPLGAGVRPLAELWSATTGRFDIEPTDAEEPALVHFTSGTTGVPKGAVHVHDAVVAHHATARYVLDLRESDVYWCTADPGWVTGTSYGIVAPLSCGVTCVVDELEYDARRWYGLLEEQRVTVWYTAPTALRMLMKAGTAPLEGHDLSALRHICSVGEPLNPEVVHWGLETLDRPIRDTWWQTETGAIMIANYVGTEVRPGSMGRPVPGIEAALVQRDAEGQPLRGADGGPVPVDTDGAVGELALRAPWPSMMRAYLGDDARYRAAFLGDWYLSGDLARRDEDGWFWFVGRGNDVIKSAGHLIGPFEVESALMEHPAVAEAGVIGVPDPIVGEVVKAFVALRPGYEPTDELRRDLIGFGRARLGNAVAPRDIAFEPDLPKTRSGKIMRRLLKARELGLPEGDLSTLEGAS
ncbi:MAG TPA: acetate--CoA ligase [Candidatus Angelobacter sp.]|nr:acetate--CoA ligase [Candidatus Angelobacter sp.]